MTSLPLQFALCWISPHEQATCREPADPAHHLGLRGRVRWRRRSRCHAADRRSCPGAFQTNGLRACHPPPMSYAR